MKKELLFLCVTVLIIDITVKAQNYQISFSASGSATTIDSIFVQNLTQCTNLTIYEDDTLYLFGTAGINAMADNKNDFKIYPNPMTESTILEFYHSGKEQVTVEIYNPIGTLVAKQSVYLEQGAHKFEILNLSSGVYVVNVTSATHEHSAKLISYGENTGSPAIIHKNGEEYNIATKNILKSAKNLVQMQYNDGEILLFKAYSGNYARVVTLLPTQNQTIDFDFIPCTDADGNHYAVVTIGTQTWMAENLNVGTMVNSTAGGSQQGNNGIKEKYCSANNAANCTIYGGLYEWDEMMQYNPSDTAMLGTTNGICPTGWHIPTHHEWTTLERAVCTSGTCVTDFPYDFTTWGWQGTDEGGKLKETCSNHWNNPNTGATDESGFTALPGGGRNFNDGSFFYLGYGGIFWSATEKYTTALHRKLYYLNNNVYRSNPYKTDGFSVRCLKD